MFFLNSHKKASITKYLIVKRPIILILGLVALAVYGCDRGKTTDRASENAGGAVENVGQRLEIVRQRGKLICGINDQLLGFSYKEPDGSYSGISVDLCRAIAAALFDDPSLVEYRHLSSEERFRAVTSGEVDLLSRNTTWNLSRDTSGGLEFPPTNFYDGQGILVSKDSGVKDIDDLSGRSICVIAGTTSESNLAEQMRSYGIGYTPLLFDDLDRLSRAYESKQCDAFSSDISELVARRSRLTNPQNHEVLDTVISKEPLGPVIANNEPAWFDAVKWISYATITAEELGISSSNIEDLADSQNLKVKRFLGTEGNIGAELGLPSDFAYRIVKHVGNYGEVYERNIGQPFGLERGINSLWIDGGLIYAPPFR